MVVPGFVSQVHTVFRRTGDLLMPCHEFCGFGHSQMLARVHVVTGRSVPDRRRGEGAVPRHRNLALAISGSLRGVRRRGGARRLADVGAQPLHAPYENPQNYFCR
jgi:hypothetical protein